MSCNDERHDRHHSNCVCDVVKFIDELQDCAANSTHHGCPTGCEIPFLGANPSMPVANTRPFQIFNKKGEIFTAPFFVPHTGGTTQAFDCAETDIFRVESVDDCCAVLRPLFVKKANGEPEDHTTFCDVFTGPKGQQLFASSSCITVDLKCFCAIQCLPDMNIAGV